MSTTNPEAVDPKPVDTVMAEVRRIKTELSERFGHDIAAVCRDARARQAESGHPVVDLSPTRRRRSDERSAAA